MKRLLYYIAFLSMVVLVTPMNTFAQDYYPIAPLPPGNVNKVINGDTLAGGVRAHPNRIYMLQRGAVYQVDEPMVINGSITIVDNDTIDGLRPPVLAPAILTDNSSIDHYFELNGKGAKVEIDSLYLTDVRGDQSVYGWTECIRLNADSISLKLRGDVFEAWTHGGIFLHSQWTKMDVQDCYFRNVQHASSYFGGEPFLSDAPTAMDTCKFINNTFFCDNSYMWSIRGYNTYASFQHNTIVYSVVDPLLMRAGYNMHVDNNIFYSTHAWGGDPEQVIQAWFLNYPDTASASVVRLRANDSTSYWSKLWGATITGPEAYVDSAAGVYPQMFDPAGRVTTVQNNAYWWPSQYMNWVKGYNDTVTVADSVDMPDGSKQLLKRRFYLPTWMSAYTKYTIDSVLSKQSPLTAIANNDSVDPGFNSDIQAHLPKLIDYCRKIITNQLDSTWFYNPTGELYPPTWPLPEDLTYSNTALQSGGTDGFAVGDLNWYPSQKAQWMITGVEKSENKTVPTKFTLSNAYPNPFNPSTKIDFSVSQTANVRLVVYNLLGQKVKTLVNGQMHVGNYTATWNGRDDFGKEVASGIYFYSLESQSFKTTKKMILMK